MGPNLLTAALPDLALVADGGTLVREIETYLTTHPTLALPSPRGGAAEPWDLGIPARPVPNWLDRIRHRPPAPVPIDTATHLRLVSRYIAAHGWTQGRLWDDTGAVCLLGAQLMVLAAGYGTPATASRARVLLMEQFVAQGPFRSVDDWNDVRGRTVAEVHAQLDRAAARAR